MNIEFEGKTYQFPDDATDEEITSFFGGGEPQPSPQPTPQATSGFVGGDVPSGVEMSVGEASQYVRPALEYGGLAVGSTVGMGAAGPAGAVAGAGLGYGMGKGMADLIDEWAGIKKTQSLVEKSAQSGKDVLSGMGMEAGGLLLGKGLSMAGEGIAKSKIGKRLVASSVKMPLSQKWVRARGPEATSKVERATGKMLAEEVPPSELGLQITKTSKAAASDAIDAEVSKITGTYNTEEIVHRGLRRAIDRAVEGEAPAKDIERITNYAREIMTGRGKEMTPQELNALKKELYKLADYDKAFGVYDSLLETMRKGVAHEARLALQARSPALKGINANYADWKLLEEALERSLARRGNRDMISLGTKVLVGRESIPLAILNHTVGHPRVKARIAFMLKNAGKITGEAVSRPTSYLATKSYLSP